MKRLLLAAIRFYRKYLSPRKRSPCCRFYPTCSAYALEAIEKRGAFAGLILSVWRILRCNPFCRGGYDPVPERGFRRQVFPTDGGNARRASNEEAPADPSPTEGTLPKESQGEAGKTDAAGRRKLTKYAIRDGDVRAGDVREGGAGTEADESGGTT